MCLTSCHGQLVSATIITYLVEWVEIGVLGEKALAGFFRDFDESNKCFNLEGASSVCVEWKLKSTLSLRRLGS